MRVYRRLFNKIISPDNLFLAWDEFKRDKRNKLDVLGFEKYLEYNIFKLSRDLKNGTYKPGPYQGFWIHDPKRRPIHKAIVRDRVLHHAVFQVLNPVFESTFIPTSFSCRIGKGTHRGADFLAQVIRAVSKNYTKPCFVLKCDIRKFFNSIDHDILLQILKKKINDVETMRLLEEIVGSYSVVFTRERERERE